MALQVVPAFRTGHDTGRNQDNIDDSDDETLNAVCSSAIRMFRKYFVNHAEYL